MRVVEKLTGRTGTTLFAGWTGVGHHVIQWDDGEVEEMVPISRIQLIN